MDTTTLLAYFYISLSVLSVFLQINSIGKPQTPATSGVVSINVLITAGLIYTLISLIQK
jgi:hypothetical protein